MAEKDFYIKKLLMDKQRFADLYNVQVFQGKQILRPENLEYVPNESGIITLDVNGKKKVIQRRRDVIMKASFGVYFILAAAEAQQNIHYAMPVRCLMYDALDYTEQVQELEKKHRNGKKQEKVSGVQKIRTGDEFLSGITAEDKIIPVISLVIYHGKKIWDGPRSLYDMMGLKDGLEEVEELKRMLPDYRLNLVCAEEMEHSEQFRTSLQYVFGMLKYNSDKQKLYGYLKEHMEELQDMDEDSYLALFAMLGEQKRLIKLMENAKERQVDFDMCKAIDDLIEDGRIKGVAQGITQGIKKGIEQGLEQGLEQGIEQGIAALILDNLEEHKTEDQIHIKLVKRFSLSPEKASLYLRKYTK